MSIAQVFELAAAILTSIGSGGVIVFSLSNWLGKVWADRLMQNEKAKHDKDLEELKARNARDIEELRQKLNSISSRISRVHEKEFTVLPEAWVLLQKAQGAVFTVVSPIKMWPDLSRMTVPQLTEFLTSNGPDAPDISSSAKDEIKKTEPDRRQKLYTDAATLRDFAVADGRLTELNNYLLLHSIFMPKHLYDDFSTVLREYRQAFETSKMERQFPSQESSKTYLKFTGVDPLFKTIQTSIQARLHYEEA
jgi:hypothetical protein